MATHLTRRLHNYTSLLKHYTLHNASLSAQKSFSTRLHPTVDVEKVLANNGPSSWKSYAAVCLVRLPIVEKELADFQSKYATLQDDLVFKSGIMNDWELEQHRQEQIIEDIHIGRKNSDCVENDQNYEGSDETSFRALKHRVEELADDADFSNINRRPHVPLILITKQQLGKDMVWMLPKEDWKEDENLRESAQRAVDIHCGKHLEVNFMSNSPSSFFKYKLPKGARNGSGTGAQLFIYRAFLQCKTTPPALTLGDVEHVLDHAWVAKDELRSFLKPKYIAAIENIVL